MKRILSVVFLTLSAGLLCADVLYVNTRGTTIRRSTNNGVNWSIWVTVTGGELRGMAADDDYVYVVNYRSIDVPPSNVQLRAYSALSGTFIDMTSFTTNDTWPSENPVACWNKYVLANATRAAGFSGGQNQNFARSYFDGTYFTSEPMVSANGGDWRARDMRVYSTPDGLRLYVNGAGGADVNMRRYNMATDGTLSSHQNLTINGPTASGANGTRDFAFSPSGRLIVLNTNGIWVSATGQFNNNPITVNRVFTFDTTSEDPSTGRMGPNARELLLLENRLYGASNDRVYRYTFNDSDGSITFVDSYAVGASSAEIQLDGVVPEPGVIGLALVAGLMVLRKRG